jgi:predicted nucleic acid-binding protein
MKTIIIDCCIIGGTCEENYVCKDILNKSMNLLVCYDKKILKEYRSRIWSRKCKKSRNNEFLMMWYSELLNSFGKKIKIKYQIPDCLGKLIHKGRFPMKDVPYVIAALECRSRVIITRDHHFLNNAESCLGTLGIEPYDENEWQEFLTIIIEGKKKNGNSNC